MRRAGKDNVMFALKALITALGIVTVGGLLTASMVMCVAGALP